MKSSLYSLLFLIVLSCAPSKKEESATDSTVVATDSTPVYTQPIYHPGPARSFPSFSSYAVTENELEVSIVDALTELLNQYDTAKYKTIKSEYTVYYKVASDYEGDSLDTSETETKTWYYSSTNTYTIDYTINESLYKKLLKGKTL